MDLLMYIMAGAAVGFAIGLTGVGGGSLMTPALLLFGFPAHIAVGTDLLYAAITKSGGVLAHQRQKTINWSIVLNLSAGSILASLATIYALKKLFTSPEDYTNLLTSSLGIMLIATSCVILFRKRIQRSAMSTYSDQTPTTPHEKFKTRTLIMGIALGFFVTLSSVGAGAFGTALLLIIYPYLRSIHVVGTDLAHAVPLTLVAGLGHLALGNVDYGLLVSLLIGSLPAILLGTRLASRLPDNALHPILAITLMAMGIKYSFF